MALKRLVTRTPQTWAGTIAEAVFGTAGRSVIVGREWFRFKKGRGLVNSDAFVAETRPELCIVRAGKVSNDQIESLRRMAGHRWSPLFNCLTAFSPFWEGRMSRISTDDRQSIARSVVLTAILAALVTIGVGALFHNYMTAQLDARHNALTTKLETYRNSMNAHFGQVKSMLKEAQKAQKAQ